MATDTAQNGKPRRWFRFRVRTLLILTAVLSLPLGWIAWELREARKDRAVLAWVEKLGGQYGTLGEWIGQRVWELNLDDTQISDLSRLAEFDELEIISLSNTKVTDLSPLVELKQLWWIDLDNTKVRDLSPLAELKKLQWLYMDGTIVSDLSPLARLPRLDTLHLSNTLVSDLSPLLELKNLQLVRLNGTPVSDEQVERLMQALPYCEIHQ